MAFVAFGRALAGRLLTMLAVGLAVMLFSDHSDTKTVRLSRGVAWRMFRDAASDWSNHNAPRLGAALAYYTVLALAPTLVIVATICGFVFGQQVVQGDIYWQVRHVIGPQAAGIVQTLLEDAHRPSAGVASVLSFFMLLLGASGAFLELRDALNFIWDAPQKNNTGAWGLILDRFFSFALVLGIGVLLTLSVALSAFTQAAAAYWKSYVPAPHAEIEAANFLTTLLITSFLFGLIYRIIPEVRVDWQDVAIGSVITALLFATGKFLIGLYLGRAGVGSAYGAAGSVVVLLVWVYYSAQIFLFGAELTHVVALRRRPPRRP